MLSKVFSLVYRTHGMYETSIMFLEISFCIIIKNYEIAPPKITFILNELGRVFPKLQAF